MPKQLLVAGLHSLQEKAAGPTQPRRSNLLARRKKPPTDLRRAGILPWLGVGTGVGALGLAHGLGSDKQIEEAMAGFERMNQPLRPNMTTLSQYADSMTAATNLRPFGVPVSELMPWLRSQPRLMGGYTDPKTGKLVKMPLLDLEGWSQGSGGIRKLFADWMLKNQPGVAKKLQSGAGIPDYTAMTPDVKHGARAHYQAFAQGPLAAVSHMMRGPRAPYAIKDPSLTGGKPMTYNEYFTPKYERFVRSRTNDKLLPNEVDLRFMPQDQQVKVLQDFHASLTPAERKEKERIETGEMAGLRSQNTANYRPLVDMVSGLHKGLKTVGYTAGGAGLGGLLGHRLYRWLTPDDQEGNIGATLAAGAGMGLGGAASYWLSTPEGQATIQRLLSNFTKRGEANGLEAVDNRAFGRQLGSIPTAVTRPAQKWVRMPSVHPSDHGTASATDMAVAHDTKGARPVESPILPGVL